MNSERAQIIQKIEFELAKIEEYQKQRLNFSLKSEHKATFKKAGEAFAKWDSQKLN